MIKTKSIIFTSITLFIFASTTQIAFAKYTVLEKIPGIPDGATFPTYVTGIYNFAIAIVLVAALLMITLGGFYYITSAGNQAQAGTAKKIITDALLGLIVVFLIYLVLNTINPDLINSTNPNLESLQSSEVAQVPKGQALQKDTHCSNGMCFDNKKECESNGGVCSKPSNNFKPKDIYIKNNDGRYVKYNGTLAECLSSGEACVTGSNLINDLKYGTKEADTRIKLEKDWKVRTAPNAKTVSLSEKGISDIRKVPDALGNEDIYIYGVSDDGKTIYTDITKDIDKIKKLDGIANDGFFQKDMSWGKSENGDKYYKVTDKSSDLYGYIFVDTGGENDKMILPKEDGSEYTLEELGIKSNYITTDTDTSDEFLI